MSFDEYIDEYREQLSKGRIDKAYRGLMGYISSLRSNLRDGHPDYSVSGNVQHGLMDYTYFYFTPNNFKQRELKVVIIFIHGSFSFEVWLSGYNKQVQKRYLEQFKGSEWGKYHIAPTTKGHDYIVRHVLIENPDFRNLDALTRQIEDGAIHFIEDIEGFLSGK